jgi:hypothetical protein
LSIARAASNKSLNHSNTWAKWISRCTAWLCKAASPKKNNQNVILTVDTHSRKTSLLHRKSPSIARGYVRLVKIHKSPVIWAVKIRLPALDRRHSIKPYAANKEAVSRRQTATFFYFAARFLPGQPN